MMSHAPRDAAAMFARRIEQAARALARRALAKPASDPSPAPPATPESSSDGDAARR